MSAPLQRLRGRLAPYALWFAALGGAVAWAFHLTSAWGVDELVCASGHTAAAGIDLSWLIALLTAVPGLVTIAALGSAVVIRRRLRRQSDGARVDRALLMATIGLLANVLFLVMIGMGGAALIAQGACSR